MNEALKKKLRIVLIIHILFFVGWGVMLATSHKQSIEIWLETAPVDPRDTLKGYYVALAYDFIAADGSCSELIKKDANQHLSTIYVRLKKTGRQLKTEKGMVTLWEHDLCTQYLSQSHSFDHLKEIWIKGRVRRSQYHTTLQFGIERFHVSENSALRKARSGDVVAKILVNHRYEARIIDLVKITNG